MESRFQIKITGGGPWGFRIQGSENQPLRISKIRKRSKADIAGLLEGDIILSVNGADFQGASHAAAMETVEAAGDTLVMDILRTGDRQSPIIQSQEPGVQVTQTRKTVTETVSRGGAVRETRTTTNTVTETSRRDELNLYGSPLQPVYNDMNNQPAPQQQQTIPDFKVKDNKSIKDQAAKILESKQDDLRLTETKENVAPNFKVKKYEKPVTEDERPAWQIPQQPYVPPGEHIDDYTVMPATPGLIPVDMHKLTQDSGETPPDTPSKIKKKKLYADSAFFNDPAEKYPTLEEQIDLARKVAQVLTSEATVQRSKGARMFNKRRERAEKWVHTADDDDDGCDVTPIVIPGKHFSYTLVMQKPPKVHYDPDQPIDHLPPNKVKISAQELEQMRLRSPKVNHSAVAPEQCFNLAAALHASKGKGGQIFAKRRAKSESWVVDESNVQSPPTPPTEPQSPKFVNPIDVTRPAKSPWAAAQDSGGSVDAAFDHLNRRHTVGSDVFNRLKNAPGQNTDIQIENCNLQVQPKDSKKFKDFNRKARGWSAMKGPSNDQESVSSRSSENGSDISSHQQPAAKPKPQSSAPKSMYAQILPQRPQQQQPTPRHQAPSSYGGPPRPAGGMYGAIPPRQPYHGSRPGYVIPAGGGSDL
ncbi:uncharacterized protein LOC141903548 isoform X2 [Tubulanus polymorphus]|uniref:uncharacterized protein LOC141903548 isoform X2 n=1 Tax=Tubulanus polymorphus TaxID=672921 RepID=UPI003DA2BD19